MTIVTIDSMSFCPGSAVAQIVAEQLDFSLVKEEDLILEAAKQSRISTAAFRRLIDGTAKITDAFKDNRPVQLATLYTVLAAALERDNCVVESRFGYFVPKALTHVLKVAIVASAAFRTARAVETGSSSKRAGRQIKRDEDARAEWAALVLGEAPWAAALFDMLLLSDSKTAEEIAGRIVSNARKPLIETTSSSLDALKDFRLAADLRLVFAMRGHDVDVRCENGNVEILIKNHTLFIERLKRQLVEIAAPFEGVRHVSARPGPRYKEAGIYLDVRSALPRKVLLVDDEKAFVETLSKRLETRHIDSVVAYGGAEALIRMRQDEPDVMVLDLKMPGIDGLEVLRSVRENNPKTEVIILTGHGSETEERLVFQLGAFAYLRKPIDIGELTETMSRAYEKVHQRKTENE